VEAPSPHTGTERNEPGCSDKLRLLNSNHPTVIL
jgi:hypothetical protein